MRLKVGDKLQYKGTFTQETGVVTEVGLEITEVQWSGSGHVFHNTNGLEAMIRYGDYTLLSMKPLKREDFL